MVWINAMIIETIGIIIPTKHTYGKDDVCLWRTFEKQKKMHGTSHYTEYAWSGFFLMGFLYPFVGTCFVHVPLHWSFHITSITFQKLTHMCMCYVHNLDRHLVCAPMLHPGSPHQIHIWKKRFYWALDLNWLWFGSSTHVYELVKTGTCNTHFLY